MGLMIPAFRRRITGVQFMGQSRNTVQTVSGIKEGVVLPMTADGETVSGDKTSRLTGDPYVTIKVTVDPGKAIFICGYGDKHIAQLRALNVGDTIDALLESFQRTRSNGQFYRLVELADVTPAAPAAVVEAASGKVESIAA